MNNDPCGSVGKADAANSKVQSSIPGECQKLEIFSQLC